MNLQLAKHRALRGMTLAVRAMAVAMIVTGSWLLLSPPQAKAAVPVSSITSCETAVAAINASLTSVSRSRIALAAAKRSGKKAAIKRATLRLASAQSQRDVVRGKIKTLCAAGAVAAQSGGCSPAIDKLAVNVDALATARSRLAAAKTNKAKLQSAVRKLEIAVDSQSETVRLACAPPAPPVQVTPPSTTPSGPAPDTTPPTVTIGVKTPTNDTTPHVDLSASESDVTFACKIDGTAIASPSSLDLPMLSEANHTLACSGTDPAGNTGPVASKSVVIDLTPPNIPLVTGPIATQATHLTFAVSPQAPGDTAECRADSDAFGPAPDLSFVHDFAVGAHHVNCILRDAAGNASAPSDLPVVVLP